MCNRQRLSGIGTEDGSAKKDEDFKGKSQRQVQFNPGQTKATWRVRILADGKYEQAETFQVLLSEPVMGAMEFPSTATVEILDPSDGQCAHFLSPFFCLFVCFFQISSHATVVSRQSVMIDTK